MNLDNYPFFFLNIFQNHAWMTKPFNLTSDLINAKRLISRANLHDFLLLFYDNSKIWHFSVCRPLCTCPFYTYANGYIICGYC